MTKAEWKEKAQQNELFVIKEYSEQIQECIDKTIILSSKPILKDIKPRFDFTAYYLTPIDSVSALLFARKEELKAKIAILNFASWVNPGGLYLDGAIAQEEALCQESFLYSILSSDKCMNEFYNPHRAGCKNQGAYSDASIYSPDIVFFRKNEKVVADVITIAAPNLSYYLKHDPTDFELRQKLEKAMESRINTVLSVAKQNEVDILILGAFGCGVFHNNPTFVATTFLNQLEKDFNMNFKKIYFAIPNAESSNYKAFLKVCQEVSKKRI